jgi:hypothetical protein
MGSRREVFGERPISSGTFGLSPRDRDFYRQNNGNSARCQRMTVSGLAIGKVFRTAGALTWCRSLASTNRLTNRNAIGEVSSLN